MRRRSLRHAWRPPVAAAALLCLATLAGCAQPGTGREGSAGSSGLGADEVAAHGQQICPKKLPQAADKSHGFGTSEPAESAPTLPAPDSAWVCQYVPDEAGPGPDGDGTTFAWVRRGPVRAVEQEQLPGLTEHLASLTPAEGERACTADLGPRWMLVYAAGTDLTGVVVDAFGCRDIRLTDEPFRTVPGEATQAGTVPGVLTGPPELLDQLVPGRRD